MQALGPLFPNGNVLSPATRLFPAHMAWATTPDASGLHTGDSNLTPPFGGGSPVGADMASQDPNQQLMQQQMGAQTAATKANSLTLAGLPGQISSGIAALPQMQMPQLPALPALPAAPALPSSTVNNNYTIGGGSGGGSVAPTTYTYNFNPPAGGGGGGSLPTYIPSGGGASAPPPAPTVFQNPFANRDTGGSNLSLYPGQVTNIGPSTPGGAMPTPTPGGFQNPFGNRNTRGNLSLH